MRYIKARWRQREEKSRKCNSIGKESKYRVEEKLNFLSLYIYTKEFVYTNILYPSYVYSYGSQNLYYFTIK